MLSWAPEPGHAAAAAVYGLLLEKEQSAAIVDDPSLIPAAVTERTTAPAHFLARQVARITLEEIFSGLSNLRLDPDREAVVRGYALRGVQHLPVVWDV